MSDKNQVKNSRAFKQRNKLYMIEVKAMSKCELCGEARAVCLDFHHRDPDSKLFSLGEGSAYGIDSLKREIKKCMVVCSNCHRVLHAKDRLHEIARKKNVLPTLFD